MPIAPKIRILLVDDEPAVRELADRVLHTAGYDVLTAADGAEGVETARHEMPDLIILDLLLPRMNGYEVCRILKQDERYEEIPVLILSGQAAEGNKAEVFECGADAYLTKPYTPDQLLEQVRRLLAKTHGRP